MSDMKKWLQLMESANVCPQCGSPDCTCEPGECDCEPVEATELEQGNNFDINETVVPSRLQQWLDKKDWTIMATKPYKLDKSSMHFLASDTLGDDREGILMKYPNEKGQYVVVFNTVPNRKDWINAMIESDELDEVTSPEIKAAYADAMKTKPRSAERKAAIQKYQKLRLQAIDAKKTKKDEVELDETRNPIKKFRRRGHEAAQQIFYGDGVFEIWYDEKGSEFPSIDKDPDGNTFADKTNDPRKLVRYAKAAFKPGQKIDVYNYGRKYDSVYKAGVEALRKEGFDVYAPMPKNDSVQEGSLSDYDKHNGIPSLAKAMSYGGKTLDDTDYMVAHLAKLGGDDEYAHSKLDNPEFMKALAAELGVADTGFDDLGSAVDDFKAGKSDFDEGEQHGNSKIYDKCWDGYRRVPGKRRGEKGSCVKADESMNEGLDWPNPELEQGLRDYIRSQGSDGYAYDAYDHVFSMASTSEERSWLKAHEDDIIAHAASYGLQEGINMNEMENLRKLAGLPESADIEEGKAVTWTSGEKPDKEHLWAVYIDGEEEGTYHSLEQAKKVVTNRKKSTPHRKYSIKRMKRTGAYTSESYGDDDFENGDRIRFKDGYDEGNGEVFTLQNWDGRRGWAADEDGRGWSVTASQIEKVDDDEESGGSIWDDPDWRDDELDEAKMRLSRDHVAKATKVWARAKKNDFLNSEASDAVIKFAMDKLKYPKERAEMLAIAAETAYEDSLDESAHSETCKACSGKGHKPAAGGMDRDCEKCDGTGKVKKVAEASDCDETCPKSCPDCGGTGKPKKDKVDESYPMAPYVEQDDETNVSFTQTKHMGDATVTVSANAKSMEELHSVLKLAGIDPHVADKYAEPETPNLPVAVDEPEMGGCGSEEPMGMSYSTDKQALIDMIRQKMQKKLG